MKIKINNQEFKVLPGQTILEIARANGFLIPTLCDHPDLDVKANCRVCVVEVKGKKKLMTACSTPIFEGMEVYTDSPRVQKSRDLNLELLFANHSKKCATCSSLFNCKLLGYARQYKIIGNRFSDRKSKRKNYLFANAVEVDNSQCIDCRNCIESCHKQGIDYLEMSNEGIDQEIKPVSDKSKACIYCGQCALHCPAASAQEQSPVVEIEKLLRDKTKIMAAQFAPAVRVSIGEEFGLKPGTNLTKQINTSLKDLGFNFIFDINFGADITTMTEAEELIDRFNDKKAAWPMFTSCCPAWVAYLEFNHPELIPNLTSARSPHIHSAGAIKTYWAKKNNVNPKHIVILSIVPCTAKKYEAARSELSLDGVQLVNYVITTREFAYLLKKHKIDLPNLKPSETDQLFNDGSGAAAIYGTSGGVMESALRTANALVCKSSSKNKICESRLEFKEVRGMNGFKEATINLNGKKIKVGVVNGLGHFKALIPKLKKYHYIEVMACPGGCLGGGGQPLSTSKDVRKLRSEGMYKIDSNKRVRKAHENKAMSDYYSWVKENKLEKKLLHTKFKKSSGSILKVIDPRKKSLLNIF
ncbi:MAG: [FeFe] hydrogenase, group A [Patescibacteria group bacterium]